jgi:hypothetical protein
MSDLRHHVTDIEMVFGELYGNMADKTSTMYCFVDSPANAKRLVEYWNGQRYGMSHLSMKMIAEIVPMTEAPGDSAVMRLSDFFRAKEAMSSTKTVRFDQLPYAHRTKTIRELFESSRYATVFDEEDYDREEKYSSDYIQYIHECEDGGVLVRFKDSVSARQIVNEYNGTYYKNATIYLTCVDDKELDGIMEERAQAKANNKTRALFIGAVKPGASTEDVRKMFAPHVPQDVQMQPGKRFAFVFMHEDAAAKFMADNWDSEQRKTWKKHGGWKYIVKYANDKKGGGKRAASAPPKEFKATPASGPIDTETYSGYSNFPAKIAAPVKEVKAALPKPSPAHVQGPAKVRVAGLAYAATEDHIRRVFENAKFEVEEVVLNNSIARDIHAVVKLVSQAEAERAISTLNGRKILKRGIAVVKST